MLKDVFIMFFPMRTVLILAFCLSWTIRCLAMSEVPISGESIFSKLFSERLTGYICRITASTSFDELSVGNSTVSCPVPMKITAMLNGVVPTAYRIAYHPKVIVMQEDGKLQFLLENRTIGTDGETLTTLTEQLVDGKGEAYNPQRGTIENANPDSLDQYSTGLAFLIANLSINNCLVLRDLEKGIVKIVSCEISKEDKDLIKIEITNKKHFSADLWLDSNKSWALRRADIYGLTVEGIKSTTPRVVRGSISQRLTVDSFWHDAESGIFYPRQMQAEWFSLSGKLERRTKTEVNSFSLEKSSINIGDFLVAFKEGTTIHDTRLNVFFQVGKPLGDLRQSINDAVSREADHPPIRN